jgi:hypothetical protein
MPGLENANFTEAGFINGAPETLFQAEQQPKILVVWPHGDELLGPKLGYHLATERRDLLEHVDYMCGNPEAAQASPSRRYIETDLNRSFAPAGEPSSYEERRAQAILGTIRTGGYNYVLDLHTSTTDVDRFFLAGRERNDAVDTMVGASVVDRVVIMPDMVKMVGSESRVPLGLSGLIGQVPHSVSVEYNADLANEVGVDETVLMLDGLIAGTSLVAAKPRDFFYVDGFIPKTNDPGEAARNFELCAEGYYPVLYGENTYRKDPTKPYLGFAATVKDTIIL